MSIENEIPKHRKKKNSSTSNANEKSDHKHEYVDCLFIEKTFPHKGTYCKLCGKIGDLSFFETTKTEDGYRLVLEAEEVFEKYKDLEQIHVDSIWQKYIPVKTK